VYASVRSSYRVKSITKLGSCPVGIPVIADEILEFHAARLLLLLQLCGTRNRIDGLTKLAKLDFFVRYPQFFNEMCARLRVSATAKTSSVESAMIRFHYGPWDQRYYHLLAYLEGKGLLAVRRDRNAYTFELTERGKDAADILGKKTSFAQIVAQMRSVNSVLGKKSGSALKKLVYDVFRDEIANKPIGEVIL
jgi:hypothetical protein